MNAANWQNGHIIYNVDFVSFYKGSHIRVACRSVCSWDQNRIKQSIIFLGANQGMKTNSERLISTDQRTCSDTKEA